MVELAESAKQQLDHYFKDHEKKPIRIYLAQGSCSGPKLALFIDEPTPEDEILKADGYEFIVEKGLLSVAAPFKIDIDSHGFAIESSLQLHAPHEGCCGCSSCSSD